MKIGWIKAEEGTIFGGYRPSMIPAQPDGRITLMRGITIQLLFESGANASISARNLLGYRRLDTSLAAIQHSPYIAGDGGVNP